MPIDLHCHSTYSDGELTPAELVAKGVALGLEALALTDHDTLDGLDNFIAAGQSTGLRTVTGVEFSVDHEDGSLHLLGYGFDHRNQELLSIAHKLHESREVRNVKIIARLNELGYRIAVEDVLKLSPVGTCGRAHIAQALALLGQIATPSDAFKTLLNRSGTAYVERYRLPLSEACEALHRAGGVAIWAHPGLHGGRLGVLLERLPRWKELGMDGIESDYRNHDTVLGDRLRRIADRNGMIYTGGSDFHGSIRPDNRLGDGAAGDPIAVSILEKLDERVDAIRVRTH